MPRLGPSSIVYPLGVAPHGVFKAGSSLEVSTELGVHLQNLFDVLHAQRFAFINCQILSGTKHIFDFSSVEIVLCQVVKVRIAELFNFELPVRLDSVYKELEDCLLCLAIESVVSQRNVYARLERFVESLCSLSATCHSCRFHSIFSHLYPVRGQEENPLEVL